MARLACLELRRANDDGGITIQMGLCNTELYRDLKCHEYD